VSARTAFIAAFAAVLALALVPWDDSPLQRLAGGEGDGPDARFDVPLDPEPLRALADATPDDTEYVTEAPGGSPLEQGNLKAAGQLYLYRLLPRLTGAPLVVVYRNGRITSERRE
jgi:hypothetical protein